MISQRGSQRQKRGLTYYYRPQRSWGKVIFSQASVILSTGGLRGYQGGIRGCQGCAWLLGMCVVARGHAWLLGGMHGCRGHVWLQGGVHGCVWHVWWWGGMCGIRRDTINEQAVRILLECFLVWHNFC